MAEPDDSTLAAARVHPSALLDETRGQIQLAGDVEIGPGTMIHGPVAIGPRTRVIGQAWLYGPLRLGADNLIYPFACLGFAPQDRGYDPARLGAGVVIGDRNVFREYVTVHRATRDRPTRIGHDNYWMANSHAGHDARIGGHCTIANNALIAGHVQLGDHAMLGGGAGIHQFARLGRLSIVSGNTAINQDVPPFCMAVHDRHVSSLNFVGLRRAGLQKHMQALKAAFDLLYRQSLPNNRAAERIRQTLGHDTLCVELANFVVESKRGLSPYIQKRTIREATGDDAAK